MGDAAPALFPSEGLVACITAAAGCEEEVVGRSIYAGLEVTEVICY